MFKACKTLVISLALFPLLAFAQTDDPTITIQVVETDPPAGASLSSNEPMYARLQYQSDKPLRLQVKGYLDGSEIDKFAAQNPAPVYPAGNGEAIAWVAYHDKVNINELRITAFDENWQILHSTSLSVAMHWSGRPSKNWRQPAQWVQTMNAQQQTMAGSSTEQPPVEVAKESTSSISYISSIWLWLLPLLGVVVIVLLGLWWIKRTPK